MSENGSLIGKRLTNHILVAIRYASVPMQLHEVICPHACKMILLWSAPVSLAHLFDQGGG